MAKVVRTSSLKKKQALAEAERNMLPHFCIGCGAKAKDKFLKSRNPRHLTGKQPYCKDCIEDMFRGYKRSYRDEYKKVFYYLCRKLDMGFSASAVLAVYTMIETVTQAGNEPSDAMIIGEYFKICNSFGKLRDYPDCFDDSDKIDELTELPDEADFEEIYDVLEVTPELVKRWGQLPHDEILFLENEYRDWCNRYTVDSKSLEVLIKEICYKQLELQNARMKGLNTKELLKALQDLMQSSALKPAMESAAMGSEQNTIGLWAKKFEDERPVPEPLEEFKDPDGITKLIRIFFLGHFCKMLGMENELSAEYENEMAKYTVDLAGDD